MALYGIGWRYRTSREGNNEIKAHLTKMLPRSELLLLQIFPREWEMNSGLDMKGE
jgi:hypothetical protein